MPSGSESRHQATSSPSDCYEECGYAWTYLFAAMTLVPAVIAAAVIGIVAWLLGRLRRARRSDPAGDVAR